MTQEALLNYISRRAQRLGTRRALAKHLGVSDQYLSDVLTGKREPGSKLLGALGFRKIISYRAIQEGTE